MFQISNFRSSIERNGVLRANRYVAFFRPPEYLKDQIAQYGYQDGLISLRCEAAQLPGVNLTTIDQPRIGWGPTEGVPHNLSYNDISLTFLLDAQTKIHRLFYDWMNTIVNFQGSRGQSSLNKGWRVGSLDTYAYEVGYKELYTTDIDITVYDNYSGGGDAAESSPTVEGNNPVMTVRMYRAYPKGLPNIDLSWGADNELVRMPIPFGFSDFSINYHSGGSSFQAGVNVGNLSNTLAANQAPTTTTPTPTPAPAPSPSTPTP